MERRRGPQAAPFLFHTPRTRAYNRCDGFTRFGVTVVPEPLLIARNASHELALLPALGNRHGLITGATGTGKTVTLQVMAERFSGIGVPVFMDDVKGDLSGITQPGAPSPKLLERLELIGVPEPAYAGSPGVFWDVYGEQGHPAR